MTAEEWQREAVKGLTETCGLDEETASVVGKRLYAREVALRSEPRHPVLVAMWHMFSEEDPLGDTPGVSTPEPQPNVDGDCDFPEPDTGTFA